MAQSSVVSLPSNPDQGNDDDLVRADFLVRAGVPAYAIQKVLKGCYDLWDDETVFWEERFPEKGKLAMRLLEPIYDLPLGLTSVPSNTDLTYLVRKAFPPPSPGPLPRSRTISLVTVSQLQEIQRLFKWLDEYTAPDGKLPPLDEVFPWGPARERLNAFGRFRFEAYADLIPDRLRLRLWDSFTATLRNVWMSLNGTKIPTISDPWTVRDLWTRGNCLPVGFSFGSVDSFIFLLLSR